MAVSETYKNDSINTLECWYSMVRYTTGNITAYILAHSKHKWKWLKYKLKAYWQILNRLTLYICLHVNYLNKILFKPSVQHGPFFTPSLTSSKFACVPSVPLHGSETWAPSAPDLQRLHQNNRDLRHQTQRLSPNRLSVCTAVDTEGGMGIWDGIDTLHVWPHISTRSWVWMFHAQISDK